MTLVKKKSLVRNAMLLKKKKVQKSLTTKSNRRSCPNRSQSTTPLKFESYRLQSVITPPPSSPSPLMMKHIKIEHRKKLPCSLHIFRFLAEKVKQKVLQNLVPRLCPKCKDRVSNEFISDHGFNRSSQTTLGSLCLECRHLFIKDEKTNTNNENVGLAKFSVKNSKLCKKLAVQKFHHDPGLPLFVSLTKMNIPWCHICGTTSVPAWRPGPWGTFSFCQLHDTHLINLNIFQRYTDHGYFLGSIKPLVGEFCATCWKHIRKGQRVVTCAGCPASYHRKECLPQEIFRAHGQWYCKESCKNTREKSIYNIRSLMPPSNKLLSIFKDETYYDVTDSPSLSKNTSEIDPLSILIITPTYRLAQSLCGQVPIGRLDPSEKSLLLNQQNSKNFSFQEEMINLDSQVCQLRHVKYENEEKQSRLLRPSILKKLNFNTSRLSTVFE